MTFTVIMIMWTVLGIYAVKKLKSSTKNSDIHPHVLTFIGGPIAWGIVSSIHIKRIFRETPWL